MSSLNQLAGGVAGNFSPIAAQNHNVFINEIPTDLPVSHNSEWLATVISGMLSVVVNHSTNAFIRLSARKYGYIIVLEVQQDGVVANYSRDRNLLQTERLAERIGGCLHITSRAPSTKVLAFSFPNLPMIA